MKVWLKLHAKQLATVVLWSCAMAALHYQPELRDELIAAAGALQLIGMQLPPFVLKPSTVVKLAGGVMLVLTFVAGPFMLMRCANPGPSQTARALAGAALDFSACMKNEFTTLGEAGALSKDAALMSAEKCGIADAPDAFAILVAIYNDVKAALIAKHSVTPAVTVVVEAPDGG